jgi:hypothetical protein
MKTTFGAWGNEVKTILKKMYGPTTYRPGDHHDRGQEYARLGFMWCLFPWHMFCMVWYFFLVFLEKKLTHFGTHCFEVS